MCGEKFGNAKKILFSEGSPPRVRGEGVGHLHYWTKYGITPACAGRSRFIQLNGRFCKDHPRVCGEKSILNPLPGRVRGSPPRVRGEAGRSLDVYRDEWITPACAGRRCQETQFETTSEDHPRVCGEKHKEPSFGDYWGGSPPRVRGEVVEGLFDPVV